MTSRHEPSVLIVDDEPSLRVALRAHFIREAWNVEIAAGVREAVLALQHRHFKLVLCDVKMADGDGFEVLQTVQAAAPDTAFLFLTAYGSVPEAVRAIRGGAVDYLTKPVRFEHLHAVAKRLLGQTGSRQKHISAGSAPEQTPFDMSCGMVGQSQTLIAALARAKAAADSDADVLIEAESGTGKELLARMVHESSARRGGPFIAVNCAALPEALLESELFGHARGAFTGALTAKAGKFEVAHGGTLLLDEIGDMPLALQPKLLRVLQERVVERLGETRPIRTNIRVIAATNLQLSQRVQGGLFRSDLFYRLNVIPLSLPPLRERREDLDLLAKHFAARFAARCGSRPVELDTSFLLRLRSYHWPGNVREFGNFMQRVISLCGTETLLTASHFDREHRPVHTSVPAFTPSTLPASHRPISLDQVERAHLQQTLALVDGNRTHAAEILGISVRTMRNKIRQYDLPPRRYA